MLSVAPACFHPYSPSAWLRVAGSDAADFLQGQFTNDIRQAGPNRAVYGLWLNQKGKVLADSFVLGGEAGEFWIGSYFSPAEVICRRLEEYIVADDVTVEDQTAQWAGVSLLGEGTGAGLALVPPVGRFFPGRRVAEENWEWVFPATAAPAARARWAGGPELTAADLERRRIAALIPAVPADIGPGDLPGEGGLEAAAISSTKGCYLGQEIMARLKSKGTVRRRLFRVAGHGSLPALPAPLRQGEGLAGELRSAVADETGGGFTGLALLTLRGLVEAEPWRLSDGSGETRTVKII